MKLSIVMPVYNECGSIREILKRVQALPHAKEVLVVDDGSLDGTRDILRELVIRGRRVASAPPLAVEEISAHAAEVPGVRRLDVER